MNGGDKVLTPENYYTNKHYFSVSEYKRYKKCELDGKIYAPITMSTPMLIGSYVDSYVEGTLDEFKNEHPEIFLSRGANKGQLKSDFQKADEICEYIDNDPILQQFLSGEKQTIMTGEIEGVPFKIKMDSYSPSIAINDLKIVATVTDNYGNYKDFITPWGYDIQLACYQEIVRQNTGEKLPCYIVAVTKENPINSVIVNIEQQYMDRALYGVQENINRYQKIKEGIIEPTPCGVCSVCVANKKQTEIISLDSLINF